MRLASKPIARLLHHYMAVFTAVFAVASVQANEHEYSPPVANDHPDRVYWGDTHLHTNQSPDAFTFGNRTITPADAYEFAMGKTVVSQTGIKAKLARPLDFLMVSDHAEFMGIFPKVFSGSPDMAKTQLGQRWANYVAQGKHHFVLMEFGMMSMGAAKSENPEQFVDEGTGITIEHIRSLQGLEVPPAVVRSVWEKVGETADSYNQPGVFTAFIGYEYTSMPDGNNLHRNVLFADDGNTTTQVVPFSSMDSGNPEDLWAYMADYEEKTGGRVLSIPHNGNVSNGLMFAETDFAGEPLTAEQARLRIKYEPIIEVTQIKGDGETHPFLSPNDEFADYETWDKSNLSFLSPKQDGMLEYEYARSALKNGLALEKQTGVNPYKFGVIGSTDSHTGLATSDEDNFFGKMTSVEPMQGRANKNFFEVAASTGIVVQHWETASSGYAAVWARDNTRKDLFDSMQRKEVYATTGPRMTVRFFGGWNFRQDAVDRHDYVAHAYQNGVPMGGTLTASNENKAPTFMVSALKDPLGANLDRIQIVKGWLDADGNTQEKVYNVAASDNRKIRGNKVKPVGNTVDVDTASYTNSIGDASLGVVWQDPDFDPNLSSFYYARVLEIPTPRWTTIDEEHFGEAAPEQSPKFGQERAYTSAIWYEPK